MLNYLKRVGILFLDTLEKVMAFVGIMLTAWSIRDLFSEELAQRYSIKTRLGILAFYLLHIFALVLATGIFGEFLLSASMATILVNVTSIVNDLFEYGQEWYFNFKRKRKLSKLESEEPLLNANFAQNALLLSEFIEQKDELDMLISQQEDLVKLNSLLDAPEFSDNQICREQFSKIAEIFRKRCELSNEHQIIDRYYQKHGLDLDETKVISETNAKIQAILERKNLMQQAMRVASTQPDHDILNAFYQKQINALDVSIRKKAIINRHFFKLFMAKETLDNIQAQILDLDRKYFIDYADEDPTIREQIKDLERLYLFEKAESLSNFINHPIQISPETTENAKYDLWVKAQTASAIDITKDKQLLKDNVAEQLLAFGKMIDEARTKFEKTKRLMEALPQKNNIKQAAKNDYDKIYRNGKKIIKLRQQIALANMEETNKFLSSSLSLVSAFLSFFLIFFSYRINTAIFEGIIRALTPAGAVASIWGLRQKLRAEADTQVKEEMEINNLKDECALRAGLVPDPSFQVFCAQTMSQKSKRLAERYPLRDSADDLPYFKTFLPSQSTQKKPDVPSTLSSTISISMYNFFKRLG